MKVSTKEYIEAIVNQMFEMDYCPKEAEIMLSNVTELDIEKALAENTSAIVYANKLVEGFEKLA